MRRKTLTLPLLAALVVAVGGCDLGVDNLNNPDRARALATGDDVEGLIAGAYSNYWSGAHYWDGPHALETRADHMSASWGNWGMNDAGTRPSLPVENTSNYTYRASFENPWEDWYAAVSAGSDGLRALDGGVEIGPGGERNARARAFALFSQGLGGCMVAALYDQAFLVDEDTDFVEGDIPLVPYRDVADFYLPKLAEAAQIAAANSFTLPAESWLAGVSMTNTEFAATIRSYMARCKTIVARSPSEREGLDWTGIIADVDAGRTTDLLVTTGGGDKPTQAVDPFWDGPKGLWPEPATWGRAHLDFVGQSDVSGNYQAWLNTPTQSRQPVKLTTPDLRMPQSQDAGSQGLYFGIEATCCPFPAARGTYKNSWYSLVRHREYQSSCAFCWFGTIPEMLAAEMDLIKAEGLLRTGDVAGGVALINKSRVGNGGLTPLTGAGPVPGCVPTKRFIGTCGDEMDALQYEYYMEMLVIYGGDAYFFTRGHGELYPGRPIHNPIPAKELETLQMDVYTFGGDPNAPGSAPPIPGGASVSGDLGFALERVSYALDRLEARRQARERALQKVLRVH